MNIAVGVYLLVHGLSHLVGFLVPWRIVTMKDEPYVTTLMNRTFDVGHTGIRIVGLLWLLTGLAFAATAVGAITAWASWRPVALGLAITSLVLCVLGLPGARIGIVANAVVLTYLLGVRVGWVS